MSGHGPHADHNDPFQRRVAVFIAGFAALLAFTTMLTNQARTAAILLASESSNQWSFFQAKSTKGIVTRAELELLEHLNPRARADASPHALPASALATAPAHSTEKSDAPAPAPDHAAAAHGSDTHGAETAARTEASYDPAELRSRLIADMARYDIEKDEIQAVAIQKATKQHHQQHREHLFEYASTISELAIVVAGIALLLHSNPAFFLSLALAGASALLTGFTALQ